MGSESELVNTTLRLSVLPSSGPDFDARVESVDRKRITVVCSDALSVGAAILIEAPDRVLLAEVLAAERTPEGVRAVLDVRNFLMHTDVLRIQLDFGALGVPDGKADAVGVRCAGGG